MRRFDVTHLVANYRQIFLQPVMHMIKLAPINFVFELIPALVEGLDSHGLVQTQSIQKFGARGEPPGGHG